MIARLRLPHLGKARVWVGELPDIKVSAVQQLAAAVRTQHAPANGRQLVAVEMALPSGAHTRYGLLGATFDPVSSSSMIRVRVDVAAASSEVISWSLASSVDVVRPGMPLEYSGDLLLEMQESPDVARLGPGDLTFCAGAHGEVGSSSAVFRRIASAVVRVMIVTRESSGEDDLLRAISD